MTSLALFCIVSWSLCNTYIMRLKGLYYAIYMSIHCPASQNMFFTPQTTPQDQAKAHSQTSGGFLAIGLSIWNSVLSGMGTHHVERSASDSPLLKMAKIKMSELHALWRACPTFENTYMGRIFSCCWEDSVLIGQCESNPVIMIS